MNMSLSVDDLIKLDETPQLKNGTLLLAFTGWMDGGDVSTGTVSRIVDLTGADRIGEVAAEPFYIYSFPGPMELAAQFRPHIKIEDGLVKSIEMPSNEIHVARESNLAFFVGKEPNLNWRTFCQCVFEICARLGISRLLFVGSFGGAVPHTREPRLYVTCSTPSLHDEMAQYGLRKTSYEGPGSFMTYMTTRATDVGLEMVSLVAEIPGYLQGLNPYSIEAMTRRLSKILKLPLELDELRQATNEWEEGITDLISANAEMAAKIREFEDNYDNDLLDLNEVV
jgi:proteasome assembly chaperone (PAC2) family protein